MIEPARELAAPRPFTPRPFWRTRAALAAEGVKHVTGLGAVGSLWFACLGGLAVDGLGDAFRSLLQLFGLLVVLVVIGHLVPTYLLARPSLGASWVMTTIAWIGMLLDLAGGRGGEPVSDTYLFLIMVIFPVLGLTVLLRATVPSLRPAGYRGASG